MDIHDLRGVMTGVILLAYLGLFAWAWAGGPNRFRDAAALPFIDDEDASPESPDEEHRA